MPCDRTRLSLKDLLDLLDLLWLLLWAFHDPGVQTTSLPPLLQWTPLDGPHLLTREL